MSIQQKDAETTSTVRKGTSFLTVLSVTNSGVTIPTIPNETKF